MRQTEPTSLDRAVEAFDHLLCERGWGDPPMMLRLRGGIDPDNGAELAVQPLDGHPAQALLGFSAPIGWTAIGVSAEGWASHYEATTAGYQATVAASEVRQRVRTVTLCDRDANLAGRLRFKDGRVDHNAPDEGLVADCLRRAMGRGTDPASASTEAFFAQVWLETIAASARRGSRQLTQAQVAGMHPAVQLLDGDVPGGLADMAEVTGAFGRVCDWTCLRQLAIRGSRVGIEPRLATWMDTGMFSRWLMNQYPPVDELLPRARRRCTPAAARWLEETLEGLAPHGDTGPEPTRNDRSGAA